MFILDRGTPSAPAKRVCATCTVQDPCNQYALDNQESGVWGGRVHKLNLKVKNVSPVQVEDIRPRKVQ
jgi:hypothetical protein